MGPEPFEIPEHFTVEFLLQQNHQGMTEEKIAADLLISSRLLQKWKKQIGWIPHSGKNVAGRKPVINLGLLVEMKEQGIKRKDMARVLDVSIGTIDYHLDRLGLSKKRKQA